MKKLRPRIRRLLHHRQSDALSNLDKGHSLHSDRIAELEKQVANLKKHKQQVPDASYTKLAVEFVSENSSLEERLGIMRDFMGRYDPNIPATFSVRHRGDLQNQGKKRTMTGRVYRGA